MTSLIWLLKEIPVELPELMEESERRFLDYFKSYSEERGINHINPRPGLQVMLTQYSTKSPIEIQNILAEQQEAEMFFECLLRGLGHAALGEDFFTMINPVFRNRQEIRNCERCLQHQNDYLTDPQPLGHIGINMPITTYPGENLAHLLLKRFYTEFRAPCPTCNHNDNPNEPYLHRSTTTLLQQNNDAQGIVIALNRRIHETTTTPARILVREVEISQEIRVPTLPDNGNMTTFELVSCVQHIDHMNTGEGGHFVSHNKFRGQFWKSDTAKNLKKSSNAEIRKSSIFLYKRTDDTDYV